MMKLDFSVSGKIAGWGCFRTGVGTY